MTTKAPVANVEFATSDLYFAAYLRVCGAKLLRTDRSATGRLSFVFEASVVNIPELKLAWVADTGKVAANSYASAVKGLKSMCHMDSVK